MDVDKEQMMKSIETYFSKTKMRDIELQTLLDLLAIYRKRIGRLGVFMYLFPVIYLLIENSVEVKINFTFFDMKDDTIIKLFFPTFYQMLLFYLAYSLRSSKKVYDLIKEGTPYSSFKMKWLDNIRGKVSVSVLFDRFVLSEFSTYVLLLPLFGILVLSPLIFFGYTLYELAHLSLVSNNIWHWVLFGFNIWIFIGLVYAAINSTDQMKDKRKKKEEKKAKKKEQKWEEFKKKMDEQTK